MSTPHEPHRGEEDSADDRRGFLRTASSTAMAGGLVASYGTMGVLAGKFLFPAETHQVGWQYVATIDQLRPGESLHYVAPTGAKVVVARQGEGNTAEDFIALSSVCPHLGCKVHWESVHDRFFCPCHNGAFDRQGAPIEGPPKAGNQSLTRFPLQVEGNLLYIEVPLNPLPAAVGREERA